MQISSVRKILSEGIAATAFALLLLLIANANTMSNGIGILGMNAEQEGLTLGMPSIILFLAAFGVGFRQKSAITTGLLIGGGAIFAGYLIVGTLTMSVVFYYANPSMFFGVLAMSFIVLGLGLLRLSKRMNQTLNFQKGERVSDGQINRRE
ncbi:MAG: hypothetical protein M3275_00465 [Thermoproteota archaeon]|nr:hypothetical protein [Thermoproteota archaeon]